ncbi:MAG TPA: hypothetical protein VE988_14295 [Gemmataceae bacterium]|nr:hypothetical protein [Gemmataceae bacterium]
MPLKHNNGQPVSPEKFEQTLEELIAQFHALSSFPSNVRGTWVHEGTRYQDELLRISVDVEDNEANQEFFVYFKATLMERFEQIDIYIASYPVNIV